MSEKLFFNLSVFSEAMTVLVMATLIMAMAYGIRTAKRRVLALGMSLHLMAAVAALTCLFFGTSNASHAIAVRFWSMELWTFLSLGVDACIILYIFIDVTDHLMLHGRGKVTSYLMLALLVINVGFALTNPWTHLYFFVDANNTLVLGKLYRLYDVLLLAEIVLMFFEILRLGLTFKKTTSRRFILSGILASLGLVLNMAFPMVRTVDAFMTLAFVLMGAGVQLHMEEDLSRLRAEAAESRVRLLSGQIHPHFIFNSLAAIKGLVAEDPELAEATIQSFSDYLRSHLDVMSDTRLVPFSSELDHVRHYVALEQADMEQALDVRYELATEEFQLPPLTVQPLVENAIRHGIRTREEWGSVVVSTALCDEGVMVSVWDDGHGFSSATARQDQQRRVGLDNVRERIERQCGGRLTVESSSEGTRATLVIPTIEKVDL